MSTLKQSYDKKSHQFQPYKMEKSVKSSNIRKRLPWVM